MSRGLTIKQKKLVKGVVSGQSQRKSGLEAGYSPKSVDSQASQILKEPKVQTALQKALKNAGIDDNRITGVIDCGLKNEDDNIKHKFLETTIKVRGDYAPEKHKVEVADYSNLKGEEIDEQLKRIRKEETRIAQGKGKEDL